MNEETIRLLYVFISVRFYIRLSSKHFVQQPWSVCLPSAGNVKAKLNGFKRDCWERKNDRKSGRNFPVSFATLDLYI